MTPATALVLALHVAAPSSLRAQTDLAEQQLQTQLAAMAPGAVLAFAEASRLRGSRDPRELELALTLFDQVRAQAPRFTAATRRACGVLSDLGQRNTAIARCREAVATADEPENALSLALALVRPEPGATVPEPDLAEARVLLERAVGTSSDALTYFGAAEVAARTGATEPLNRFAARLRSLAADEPTTWYLSALGHAQVGSRAMALEELERARKLGFPEEACADLRGAVMQEMPFYERWGWSSLAVVASLVAVSGLLAGIGVFFGRARRA